MEDKFRPIQVSIIDFLGVIVPGLVWLVLVMTALLMFTAGLPVVTPMTTWHHTTQALILSNEWIGAIGLTLSGTVLGYMVKPKAMRVAGCLALPLAPLHRRLRRLTWKEIAYPYRAAHENAEFYPILIRHLSELMGCNVLALPGNQPFTTAKRLLRVVEPRLWEECEHLEAEVRLIGALFAASVLSCGLALSELVREAIFWSYHPNAGAWAVVSVVAAIVLGDAFNHMRLREVEYTYLHALLAKGIHKERIFSSRETGRSTAA